MIGHLFKIITRKKSFVMVFLTLLVVSFTTFHLVLQVDALVDKNVEYQFREYRPHVVYFTRFILPKEASYPDYPLMADIQEFTASIRREMTTENFSAEPLVGFSWSDIKPVEFMGKQINVVVYLVDNLSSLSGFGFHVNADSGALPENAVVMLESNLTPEMNPGEVLSLFFGRNVSVVKATKTALGYPLLSSKDYGILYVQIAAPLKDWVLNACIQHLRKPLSEGSGVNLLVYTAVNFRHPINNLSRLELVVKEAIPNQLFPKALWDAYQGISIFRNRTVYLEVRSPTSDKILLYSNSTYYNYTEQGLWRLTEEGVPIVPATVFVERSDIVDLVKDSRGYVLRFFVGYGGLLVVLYLPLFLLLLYTSSVFYGQLMEDLDVLSLRGMSKDHHRVVDLTVLGVCLLAVLFSYEASNIIYGKPPSALVSVAVAVISYLTLLVSRKLRGNWRVGTFILPLLTVSFIVLGYLRINGEVLMDRGLGFLVILLAFLYALSPLMGLYYGVLSEQLIGKLTALFQKRNPLPYYERILQRYTRVLAFSAYTLAIGLLPWIMSTEKVIAEISSSNEYFSLVGYGNVSILGLLSEYLKELALIFGAAGCIVGLVILGVYSIQVQGGQEIFQTPRNR